MPKRILVVEDEEDNLIVITQILELVLGLPSPLVATDGHEAIRMTYEHKPDIILLDLTLPKLTGWEVAKSLSSDRSLEGTAILALTAHAMVGDRERAIEAGCSDYFTKPIDVDRFLDFIAPYLD